MQRVRRRLPNSRSRRACRRHRFTHLAGDRLLSRQGAMAPDSYNGTVAVEPNGDGKSTIYYALFYNQHAIPAEKRASGHERLSKRFQVLWI